MREIRQLVDRQFPNTDDDDADIDENFDGGLLTERQRIRLSAMARRTVRSTKELKQTTSLERQLEDASEKRRDEVIRERLLSMEENNRQLAGRCRIFCRELVKFNNLSFKSSGSTELGIDQTIQF